MLTFIGRQNFEHNGGGAGGGDIDRFNNPRPEEGFIQGTELHLEAGAVDNSDDGRVVRHLWKKESKVFAKEVIGY